MSELDVSWPKVMRLASRTKSPASAPHQPKGRQIKKSRLTFVLLRRVDRGIKPDVKRPSVAIHGRNRHWMSFLEVGRTGMRNVHVKQVRLSDHSDQRRRK